LKVAIEVKLERSGCLLSEVVKDQQRVVIVLKKGGIMLTDEGCSDLVVAVERHAVRYGALF